MFLRWITSGSTLALSIYLLLSVNVKNGFFTPANLLAIALAGAAYPKWEKLRQHYEDAERQEDTLSALKDTQVEEQLEYLQSASETKRSDEVLDKNIERQLKILEATAPLISEILKVTGQQGPVVQMGLGMLVNGANIGQVLTATADAQMQLEQAKLNRQLELQAIQAQQTQQLPQTQSVAVATLPQAQAEPEAATQIKKAAAVVGVKTELVKIDKAPSYQRLVFSLRTVDFELLPKWKKAAKLATGVKEDFPCYVHGSEQVAMEISLKPEERTFYDFPARNWKDGDRVVVIGQSLDGEVVINLANEDTPQILVAGTTGSGKSNFLRMVAYCLLMQGAQVDICGGKVSDYEDFTARFPTVNMNDMGRTAKLVNDYYVECDRRNSMSKEQLAQQKPWILLIDEYKGTVPLDEKAKKFYDDQLSEVIRRGRGLKLHVVIGLQRGSKRAANDPQGLPPDIRDNLPCRIAFKMVDAAGGRMVLNYNGECVTSLQGKGDGIIQAGLVNTRFQAYRFDTIPA